MDFSPEILTDAISESLHRRVSEIDMVTNAVAAVYNMQEYAVNRQVATDEVAARTVIQTEVTAPTVAQSEIAPIIPIRPTVQPVIQSEAAQISDHEAEARRRMEAIYSQINNSDLRHQDAA